MSMKKLLACLLALMMALALVACGGDTAGDDANVDDQSPAVEDDANTGAGAGTPLETMTFVEVPEYIVGSRWEFCGGFVNGTEMSDELTGSCGADEENMMVVITMPNGDGTSTDLTCLFADLNGTTIMVMLEGDDSNNGLYFRMIEEG